MNYLIEGVLFATVFLVLLGVRFVVCGQSRIGLLSIKPPMIGHSLLWLYRVNVPNLLLLSTTIVFRTLLVIHPMIQMVFIGIAGASFWAFCKINNAYDRAIWFSVGIALQLFIWTLLFILLGSIVGSQITGSTIIALSIWLFFDFFVSHFAR